MRIIETKSDRHDEEDLGEEGDGGARRGMAMRATAMRKSRVFFRGISSGDMMPVNLKFATTAVERG